MAQVVSIQIKIEDNGSGAVIDGISNKLNELGVSGTASIQRLGGGVDQATGALTRMNAAGAPALRWMQQMGGHATTSLDNVRLLSQEFGFRLPRAMESALSRMPQLTAALGGMSTGLLAIGGAEVFIRMGTEVYDLYERFISIEAPMDKFYDTLRKTSEIDFSNTLTLETTMERLGQAQQSFAKLPQMAKEAQQGFLPALMTGDIYGAANSLAGAHNLAQMGADSGQQMFALTKQQADQTHQQALAQIELNHALDETLGKRRQAVAEAQKDIETAAETRLYNRRVEQAYGNPVPRDAGLQEEQTTDAKARAAAQVKLFEMDREERDQRIAAQNEAVNSGLEGEARYTAMREEAIDAIARKYHDGELTMAGFRAIRAATEEKFDNEAQDRLQKQIQAAQQALRSAQAAGMTGTARIYAEQNIGIERINTDRTLDPQAAALQRQALQAETDQKIAALEEQLTDRVRALVDQRTEAQLGGFARIDAAAQKERDELDKLYSKAYPGGIPASAQAQHDKGVSAINSSADSQKRDLAQKNAADDLQYTREAAQAEAHVRELGVMGWVSAYKDGIAEIRAQEEQRLAKLQEDAQKEGLTWQEMTQRQADIVRAANAQVAEQSLQLQHQIAGNLQAAFTNPADFIKQKMEQMFFEVIAAWIMRTQMFQRFFGNTLTSLQPGGAAATGTPGMGSIVRNVFGLGGAAAGAAAPTGTAGVIHSGVSLPQNYDWSSGTVNGGVGTTPISSDGTFSPMSTIGGIQNVTRSISQLTGRNAGTPGFSSQGFSLPSLFPGASGSADTSPSGSGGLGMDHPSLTDMNKIMFPGGSPGAMQSVAGGPSLSGVIGQAGGFAAAGFAAYQGIEGVANDFHTGGVKGALGGTMSGAEAGAAIGSIVPVLGTAVGAIAGAIVGLGTNVVGDILGESGRFAARDYYKNTLFPQLEQIENGYNSGSGGGDFLGAISQANSTASQGMAYMAQKWGKDAAQWVDDNYLEKEKNKVLQDIMTLAGGGHQYTQRSAMQFHTGGVIGGFGDLGTSSTEGFIHAQLGEHVIMPQPAAAHGPFLSAINSGANAAQMAAMYLQASSGGGSVGGSSVTNNHTHNYNALDMKSFRSFLNDGGAKEINLAQNKRAQMYGGSGVG